LVEAIFNRRPFGYIGPTIIPFFADIDDAILHRRIAEAHFEKHGIEVDLIVMPIEIAAAQGGAE
jgi:hypothetical protein